MNGATALVSMLSGYAVDVIFGVPGDTNVALNEALRTAKDAPRHIPCRERSAVFMADCYARLSGKPGVAEVPSGAGALYGLLGVAEANKSSVPLIFLVNDIPQPGVGRGTLAELPVEALFKPISKRAETLRDVGKLPEIVRRAFREERQRGAAARAGHRDPQSLPASALQCGVGRRHSDTLRDALSAVASIADRLPPVFSWLKKVGVDPAAIGVQAAL